MLHIIKTILKQYNHKSFVFSLIYQELSRVKAMALKGVDDETYLRVKFRVSTGERLNLRNPQTFNEKIQWLKLYNRNPLYTELVDKYTVRDYVEKKIGSQYLTKCYGVYSRFDEIDFDQLPDTFVIKCTHDCGSAIFCKSKKDFSISNAKRRINKALKQNYYYQGREWPYKNTIPRIIIEEYLGDNSKCSLYDYKFFCFDGIPKALFVASGRYSGDMRVDFFDIDFNKLPFERGYPNSDLDIEKPVNFDKMVELASALSEDIPFVRVDFYNIDGRVVFGELTFSPGGGMEVFRPKEWDYVFGSWIKLPKEKTI